MTALSIICWRRDRTAQLAIVVCLGRKAANVGWTLLRRRNGRHGLKFSHGTSLAEIHANWECAFLLVRLEPCFYLGAIFQWAPAPKSHQFCLLLLRRGSGPGERG